MDSVGNELMVMNLFMKERKEMNLYLYSLKVMNIHVSENHDFLQSLF